MLYINKEFEALQSKGRNFKEIKNKIKYLNIRIKVIENEFNKNNANEHIFDKIF